LRDFLFVGDAVEATIRAAVIPDIRCAINIVSGDSVSVKEVVAKLTRLLGFRGEVNFLLDKPAGESMRFDNAFMNSCLGSWPMTSLEEGLASEVGAFRRLPHES
jgi:nucleoside-diphosphate-sugar epimerase